MSNVSVTRLLLLSGILFFSCRPNSERVKFQQYFAQGELLYAQRCSNCHQKSGKGLGLVYPPLDNSDYLEQSPARAICLVKNGVKGEIIVNGKNFNQPMPGIPMLTELELAEIMTYVYNSWGRQRGLVDVAEAGQALNDCGQ